jgi:hypothetical protein
LPPSVPAGHDTPVAAGNESVTSVETITISSVETIWVTIVELAPATNAAAAENSTATVPNISVPNISVPNINVPSVSAPNASAPNTNLDAALAAVAPSQSDPNTPHGNQPAISIAVAPTETSNATVALASVQLVRSVDAVTHGIEATSSLPVQLSSGTQWSPTTAPAFAPSNHQQFVDSCESSSRPIGMTAGDWVISTAASEALMLGIPIDVSAIDRAFGAVRQGIEAMGHDVVGWIDELRASDWGLMAFAGLLAGGSYVCLQRRAAKGPGSNADDGSSWFLTQWHNSSEHA